MCQERARLMRLDWKTNHKPMGRLRMALTVCCQMASHTEMSAMGTIRRLQTPDHLHPWTNHGETHHTTCLWENF